MASEPPPENNEGGETKSKWKRKHSLSHNPVSNTHHNKQTGGGVGDSQGTHAHAKHAQFTHVARTRNKHHGGSAGSLVVADGR